MASPLVWRRSATAVGMYGSVVAGVLGTLLAARQLGPHAFGLLALALAAASFFQVLLDVTVEEAMIKFGFRYTTGEDWGRLRRLYRVALGFKGIGAVFAGIALLVMAPFGDSIFSAHGLTVPLLLAAGLPFVQAPEPVAGAALVLRGRYDVRAYFLLLSMLLRLAGYAVGSRYGVAETVGGILAAQAVASAAVGAAGWTIFRRFPASAPQLLGRDRREIVRFVLQSSIATGIISLRGTIAPLLLGMVTSPVQVGFFRAAQAPQSGLTALTSPARLILLTEQTRDWERGNLSDVFAGVRRFSLGAAVLMAPVTPLLYWFMPDLIRIAYGHKYSGASDAARLMLLAGALQLVLAWTKSLPVSIGRPGLRILAHGVETVVLVPLVVVFGSLWAATGAAAATLVATAVFSALWLLLLVRIRRESELTPPAPREPEAVRL